MTSNAGEPSGSLNISRAVVPLVSLGLIFLFWQSGHRWVAVPVVAGLLVYYFVLPRLVQARLKRFQREAMKLLTSNRANEVPGLARSNFILQLFGPRGPLDAQLGLAYAQVGDLARAISHLENAIRQLPPALQTPLRAQLAKALFLTGELERAERIGCTVLKQGTRLPEVLAIVARSRIGLGKVDEITTAYLEEAGRLSPSREVQAMIDRGYGEFRAKKGQAVGSEK